MSQITTNEFPESLQKLLLHVEESNMPLTVTHEGKPLVVIYPASANQYRAPFGAMKGSGEILGDIVSPLDEPWEVLQ